MGSFEVFEELAELFLNRHLQPTWRRYPSYMADPWSSLKVFLRGYAFERRGRPEDFSHAAVDAIAELEAEGLDGSAARRVWDAFRDRLQNKNLNHANNPLCPRGERYTRKYRGVEKKTCVAGSSAVAFAVDKLGGEPLIAWAKRLLEDGSVQSAHKALMCINGVGNKIASLFLRDVATHFRIEPAAHRELLQPIDGWVRFVVRLLAQKELTDSQCAAYVVENSNAPEKANQGMWYFCADVGRSSQYVVWKCLGNDAATLRLVHEHLDALEKEGKIATQFIKQWEKAK